ncbi:hypothetical protein FMK69_03245 [Klebsiella variicola]|nr:hypothetical protein [Klebsiella variicola]
MDSHDPKRIATGRGRQNWRAFRPVMHLHENHYTKRAGVAGIRARASWFDRETLFGCSNCRGLCHVVQKGF